jgi:aspartyl aminopeptidase
MSSLARAEEFLRFVNGSRSPFHAVHSAKKILTQVGFEELHENVQWNLKHGGKYYYTRNQSCIVAFSVGHKFHAGNGFNFLASHTDSPCFKLKPLTNVQSQGFNQVGVSTYGGGLWHTWFDRDLTIAGRVLVSTEKGIESRLVDIDRPILRIPNLAIHLSDRSSDGFKINNETHLRPVLETAIKSQFETTGSDLHNKSLLNLIAKSLDVKVENIINFELSVADFQPATIGGINNEFIFSARLDNLMHCFTSITSLAEASSDSSLTNETNVRAVLLFDNEEVGSRSAYGAMSPIISEVIERVNSTFKGSNDHVLISKRKSFLVSADMAHCIHPNYSEKHDSNHKPMMHRGPVIKINLENRYSTNAESEAVLEFIAKKHKIPVQKFCVRNDMACGTTVGPILSADSGIRSVDIGNPQWSMHSIRETCGVDDVGYCIDLCKHFLEEFASVDAILKVDY